MDAGETAALIGTKLSGLAMWPTLVCDGSEGTLIVSRGRNGEAQKSHWQTVLQLMSDEPLSIEAGDSVSFDFEARPEKAVTKAATSLGGGVQRGQTLAWIPMLQRWRVGSREAAHWNARAGNAGQQNGFSSHFLIALYDHDAAIGRCRRRSRL